MRAWPYQQWDFTTLCAHLSEIFHVDIQSYECSTIHASSVAATSALPASFALSDAVFPRRSVSRQSAPRPRSHSTAAVWPLAAATISGVVPISLIDIGASLGAVAAIRP